MWRMIVGVALVMALTALAQDPAGVSPTPPLPSATPTVSSAGAVPVTAEAPPRLEGMSWREALDQGGWLMYVLAGMSVFGLSLVIYFVAVLRPGQIAPRHLKREVVEKLQAGEMSEARKLCEFKPSPLSMVALAAMDYLRSVPGTDPTLLKDVVVGEGTRQAERIQGQTTLLLDIAAVAPMVGLLGTVFGMLKAFGSVAHDVASAKPVVLAAGLTQAMVTTAFGLMVGIPAMMFYAYFRRRASQQISVLEAASTEVLAALLTKQI